MTTREAPDYADDVDTAVVRDALRKIVASSDRGDLARAASRIEEALTDIDNRNRAAGR